MNNQEKIEITEIEENKQIPSSDSTLRIRKLTPRECGRLMGIKDEDINLILENQTNASAYHLFGDSIVVNCLMAIFSQLLNVDWETKFKPNEWWNNQD